jgi:hypothetical protein
MRQIFLEGLGFNSIAYFRIAFMFVYYNHYIGSTAHRNAFAVS